MHDAHWSDEVGAADWITQSLHPFAHDVGSVIPEGFERYVRIFHPARTSTGTALRWAEIARRNDRIVHPEMQYHAISRPIGDHPQDEPSITAPRDGQMDADELAALVEILTPYTFAAEDCWFCLWDGYGALDGGSAMHPPQPGIVPGDVRAGPRVHLPHRAYYLYRGPVTAVAAVSQWPELPANLWWPDDHAWCVATEIDFAWTYVGGSRELQDAILTDQRLESLPAAIHDRFTVDSDRRNTD